MGVDEGNLQVIDDIDVIDTGKLSNSKCHRTNNTTIYYEL